MYTSYDTLCVIAWHIRLYNKHKVNFDYLEAPDSVMDAVSGIAAGVSNYPIQD